MEQMFEQVVTTSYIIMVLHIDFEFTVVLNLMAWLLMSGTKARSDVSSALSKNYHAGFHSSIIILYILLLVEVVNPLHQILFYSDSTHQVHGPTL